MKKQGILERMASLREQANVIRAIYYDFTPNEVGNRSEEQKKNEKVASLLGGISELEVIKFLSTRKDLFISDKKEKDIPECGPGVPSTDAGWRRRSRIGTLYQACKDAKFIEPLEIDVAGLGVRDGEKKWNAGVRITDRGLDLLGFLGFWSIFFEKHGKVVAFFWGIIATLVVSAIGRVISHLGEIWDLCVMLKWCHG